jgi:hypothetical protein
MQMRPTMKGKAAPLSGAPQHAKKGRSRPRKEPREGAWPSQPNAAFEKYSAYAVTENGERRRIRAQSIIVDLGNAEVQIDLYVPRPVLAGQLRLADRGDGILVVGHGDAGKIHIRVETLR